MYGLATLVEVVTQLEDWISTLKKFPEHYRVELVVAGSYQSLSIGPFQIWDINQDDGAKELTFEACKAEFKRLVEEIHAGVFGAGLDY